MLAPILHRASLPSDSIESGRVVYIPHPRPYPPRPRPNTRPDDIKLVEKANHVRDAFIHAWQGYQKNAMGHDELLPVSGGMTDKYNNSPSPTSKNNFTYFILASTAGESL